MSQLLLGVDIGTASTKGALVRPDGVLVATATRDHRASTPRPGWVEHHAEEIWWREFTAVTRELVGYAPERIAAVGVSGIGPCVVPCDANDKPLRPAILYGVDTRASGEVSELTALLGEEAIFQRCGSILSSQALGPKLLWLQRHEPDVMRWATRWHMASSFVVARLTGEWALDHHSASQCDPLYDLDGGAWAADWCEQVVPGLPLPPLAWPSDVVGEVRSSAAAATGLHLGTPVIAGTIDSWAEAASVGVRAPGDLMLQYGSTVFLVLEAKRRAEQRSIWTTRGVDRGSLTLAAGLATAGSLTEWLRTLAGGPDFEELIAEAENEPVGADGLVVLPYFAGERTPILDPRARGTIVGLTLRHGRSHLYRACLEATAYAIRHNLEAFATPTRRIVAAGGGTRSSLWPQIVSDVTGVVQELPEVTLGAAYGDALLAAEGVGLVAPRSSWASTRRTIEPRAEASEIYAELYRLYRQLYPATALIQHELAALQLRDEAEHA